MTQAKLEAVRAKIAKLEAKNGQPSAMAEAFGTSPGYYTARQNRARFAETERSIDRALELQKLKAEEARLARAVEAAKPEVIAAEVAKTESNEARIRSAGTGAKVRAVATGLVGEVVRLNGKTASVQFGLFKEAIPYRLLRLAA